MFSYSTMLFSIAQMSATIFASSTLGRALELHAEHIAGMPSNCTQGRYYCSAANSPVRTGSIVLCGADYTLVLSANCGGEGCCKYGSDGLPHCIC
ncbi:hypothetical protein GGI35DRAFT_463179 [Trichoderma velutinum]